MDLSLSSGGGLDAEPRLVVSELFDRLEEIDIVSDLRVSSPIACKDRRVFKAGGPPELPGRRGADDLDRVEVNDV